MFLNAPCLVSFSLIWLWNPLCSVSRKIGVKERAQHPSVRNCRGGSHFGADGLLTVTTTAAAGDRMEGWGKRRLGLEGLVTGLVILSAWIAPLFPFVSGTISLQTQNLPDLHWKFPSLMGTEGEFGRRFNAKQTAALSGRLAAEKCPISR